MLLPLQGVNTMTIRNPGCRFACPGLGAVALSGRALSDPQGIAMAMEFIGLAARSS